MRFDELASKAGKAAADVGRRADRPAIGAILAARRRALIAGWLATGAVVVFIVGAALLWPASGAPSLPDAGPPVTSATASPTTTTLPTTTLTEEAPVIPGKPGRMPGHGSRRRFLHTGIACSSATALELRIRLVRDPRAMDLHRPRRRHLGESPRRRRWQSHPEDVLVSGGLLDRRGATAGYHGHAGAPGRASPHYRVRDTWHERRQRRSRGVHARRD